MDVEYGDIKSASNATRGRGRHYRQKPFKNKEITLPKPKPKLKPNEDANRWTKKERKDRYRETEIKKAITMERHNTTQHIRQIRHTMKPTRTTIIVAMQSIDNS